MYPFVCLIVKLDCYNTDPPTDAYVSCLRIRHQLKPRHVVLYSNIEAIHVFTFKYLHSNPRRLANLRRPTSWPNRDCSTRNRSSARPHWSHVCRHDDDDVILRHRVVTVPCLVRFRSRCVTGAGPRITKQYLLHSLVRARILHISS